MKVCSFSKLGTSQATQEGTSAKTVKKNTVQICWFKSVLFISHVCHYLIVLNELSLD